MAERCAVNVDLAALRREDGSLRTVLAWGDPVDVVKRTAQKVEVEIVDYVEQPDGSIKPRVSKGYLKRRVKVGATNREVVAPAEDVKVLRVDFVDVQQGDGVLIETPGGKVITLDGGDNQLFARYLANRYRGSAADRRKAIDAMVVSHGDADHFAGLTQIHATETQEDLAGYKRLFVRPLRVFHNGLVKRPSSVREAKILGDTVKAGKDTIITGLEEDLLGVPATEMNKPFKAWRKALKAWHDDAGPIEFRRLAFGDGDAFGFLAGEGIAVEVLGPLPTAVDGKVGLRFLGRPRGSAPVAHADEEFGGLDASRTINGHSIVLRLSFGNWRMLFAGDLNTEAEKALAEKHAGGELDLTSEVFKVPHHGSHEFSPAFLRAVSPLVSVVSSGDESARKEYVHPRATLISGLGRHARSDDGLVFVTEMVAFFEAAGWVSPQQRPGRPPPRRFFAFRRTAFGIVRLRTDGRRLLVYTDTGKRDLKEVYAYEAPAPGETAPVGVVRA